jgi:hypothetical protein
MADFGSFRGFGEKLAQGQTPTQLGLIGTNNFGFDSDTIAYILRVTTAGGSLTDDEQNAVDTLVKKMKTDGIWTKMKAVYPFIGSSAAACAQNLKSSSFTGTFLGTWTYASTGVKGNGSSNIFNTTLIPNTDLSQNDAHTSCYIRDNATNGKMQMGQYTSGRVCIMGAKYNTVSAYIGINSTENLIAADTGTVRGLLTQSRIVSTQSKYYKNASVYDTNATSSTTPGTFSIYVGCVNVNNAAFFPDIVEFAFASIGNGLTDTDASNYYTAVQGFQTTLARQV